MSRITPLLPSLRERKRYLAFEILSESKINDFSVVSNAIHNSCLRFLGELECAKAGIWMVKYDSHSQRGILRVDNRYANHLKSALLFVNEMGGEPTIVRSMGLSGMLNKAESRYLAA
jgi:ribonuclease P/MRP protein subunit POP5